MLGALSVLGRLPPRGESALDRIVRFHPRLAVVLPDCLLRARWRAAG